LNVGLVLVLGSGLNKNRHQRRSQDPADQQVVEAVRQRIGHFKRLSHPADTQHRHQHRETQKPGDSRGNRPDRHRPGVPCQTARVCRCAHHLLPAWLQMTLGLVDTHRLAVAAQALHLHEILARSPGPSNVMD